MIFDGDGASLTESSICAESKELQPWNFAAELQPRTTALMIM
jgi:hypothetical protein